MAYTKWVNPVPIPGNIASIRSYMQDLHDKLTANGWVQVTSLTPQFDFASEPEITFNQNTTGPTSNSYKPLVYRTNDEFVTVYLQIRLTIAAPGSGNATLPYQRIYIYGYLGESIKSDFTMPNSRLFGSYYSGMPTANQLPQTNQFSLVSKFSTADYCVQHLFSNLNWLFNEPMDNEVALTMSGTSMNATTSLLTFSLTRYKDRWCCRFTALANDSWGFGSRLSSVSFSYRSVYIYYSSFLANGSEYVFAAKDFVLANTLVKGAKNTLTPMGEYYRDGQILSSKMSVFIPKNHPISVPDSEPFVLGNKTYFIPYTSMFVSYYDPKNCPVFIIDQTN